MDFKTNQHSIVGGAKAVLNKYRDTTCVYVCVSVYLSLSCAQLLLVGGVLFWVSYRTLVRRGGSLFTGILPSTSANQP